MGQCAMTGKMVPEDELVEIQGQRVCAEGKAILMARLASGEALPGEADHPTVLRRFGCIFLDAIIVGIPIGIASAVGAATTRADPIVTGMISIAGVGLQVAYFGAMHGNGGQTLGKKAGHELVVNLDGSPITPSTAFIRALAYCGPGILSGISILTGNPAVTIAAGLIVGGWGLANILCALFDSKMQRSLHDRIAGTRVIMKP
jgi:uncharacterized RDD family membrane protein YckC